jgi:hypothetical protein
MIVLPQDTDIPVVSVNMGFRKSRQKKIKRSYREETKGSSMVRRSIMSGRVFIL